MTGPLKRLKVTLPSKSGVKHMSKSTDWRSKLPFSITVPRTKLSRGKVCLAGAALLLAGTTAALAISVLLPPGATLTVPATTAATEPTLDGVVIHDELVPFSITTASGTVLCAGQLQDRVVQSAKTGLYDFYYAIRDTKGTGAIARIVTESFAKLPLRVAYRTDGLGTVPPRIAARSAAPGAAIEFKFTDPPVLCERHEESRFMLIRTNMKIFKTGGKTEIVSTTGAAVAVPTVMP
jgi:hypothetical protein